MPRCRRCHITEPAFRGQSARPNSLATPGRRMGLWLMLEDRFAGEVAARYDDMLGRMGSPEVKPGRFYFFCSLGALGSRGRPRNFSPTMFLWISAVPPQMVSEREKKNADIMALG